METTIRRVILCLLSGVFKTVIRIVNESILKKETQKQKRDNVNASVCFCYRSGEVFVTYGLSDITNYIDVFLPS